jgi:hypothetical protein
VFGFPYLYQGGAVIYCGIIVDEGGRAPLAFDKLRAFGTEPSRRG